jgi:hypothetical protein
MIVYHVEKSLGKVIIDSLDGNVEVQASVYFWPRGSALLFRFARQSV